MSDSGWHIYVGEIPHGGEGDLWVSFESDPTMKKNKANIYGRCLPCISSLYEQLQEGKTSIRLDNAFQCWKITAIVRNVDECLALLGEFEKSFPGGHVYGKFGSGRKGAKTMAVVFHTENEEERDRLAGALAECRKTLHIEEPIQISRGCAILYHDLLGDWRSWQPVTPIKHPEMIKPLLERLKAIMYRASMQI